MTSTSLAPGLSPGVVLADVFARGRVRKAMLVIGAVMITALSAQIVVPLGFTPVPITGQTFAVLLVAAAVGPALALTSMSLYLMLGAAGAPMFAEAASGPSVLFGATGGYLFGFLAAAIVVGRLARHGYDRTPLRMAGSYLVGMLVIYVAGVAWLAASSGLSAGDALRLGFYPFVLGDLIKAAAAAAVLPGAWKVVAWTEQR